MKSFLRDLGKRVLPRRFWAWRGHQQEMRSVFARTRPLAPRQCPLCSFSGLFGNFGHPPRLDAKCPKCGSLERHRLFWLAHDGKLLETGRLMQEPILHFAPERILEGKLRSIYSHYVTADLFMPADLKLNLEALDVANESYGTVIANHVLEHVDDRAAFREICRVLKPGGLLVASVPIIEGWERTYENPAATTPADRVLHFGQSDHVRFYGRDFRDCAAAENLRPEKEITAEGKNVIDYGLLRGEKIFTFRK